MVRLAGSGVTALNRWGQVVRRGSVNPNANTFYRVVHGDDAYRSLLETGNVISNNALPANATMAQKLAHRPTAFPSFSKGSASMEYANSNPNHYIITTKSKLMKPSTAGRHGVGTTQFPTVNGQHVRALSGKAVNVFKPNTSGGYDMVYSGGRPIGSKNTFSVPVPSIGQGVNGVRSAEVPAYDPKTSSYLKEGDVWYGDD